MSQKIQLDNQVTVGTLAEKLMIPVSKLITELMKNGVMASVNEQIDRDTAEIIIGELGLDVEIERLSEADEADNSTRRQKPTAGDNRPPVVAVMGHVDHGKTTLLDAIRGANTVAGEAGGITQHISAYQVEHKNRKITFLDTPGHEAFAALRQHGAQATDLALIVVAADDGIKPQTVEAIRYAQKAGVKILVAINKIDKEGADANRIKQQLSEHNLLVEEWGGDTVTVEVSAKNKTGIDKLLDMVMLVSDVEELKADPKANASGIIIESHMELGRGPVAIALIENGTLNVNEYVVSGGTYAKIRQMESTDKKVLKTAGPSTPVKIVGFKSLPDFGDEFTAAKDEKTARVEAENINERRKSATGKLDMSSSELIHIINRSNELEELPIIVKADVQGSLTSVIDSLKTLNTEEVAVRVVGSGVGPVTENDVHVAHISSAIVYGFHSSLPTSVKKLAQRDKVDIRLFKVIYELIDDTKEELTKLLKPKIVEEETGTMIVKGIFKTTKNEVICGGEVTKGKLTLPSFVRITRDKELIAEAEVTNLKKGPQDAKEIIEGEMCGVSLSTQTKVNMQEGDRLEFFTRETKARTL